MQLKKRSIIIRLIVTISTAVQNCNVANQSTMHNILDITVRLDASDKFILSFALLCSQIVYQLILISILLAGCL